MIEVVETSWWLDWSGLPDRLLWARLRVFASGSAEVLDLDGHYHCFDDREAAVFWLNEDEYSLLDLVIQDGDVGLEVCPPTADDDTGLVPLMTVRRGSAI